MELTKEQRVRYSRTLMLPAIGEEGQERLLGSSVLIAGAGALGSICAMYLAASGVGRIGIADFDTIGLSNLQRQLSYTMDDLGKYKVDVLARRLREINPEVRVDEHRLMLSAGNIREIAGGYDVIVEGSDNPSTKYLVTDTATALGLPCVLGGVREFVGQVMTFPGGTSGYRDLFPDAPCEGGFTPCSVGGVLGPLPGVIASMQAAEVIKLLTGNGLPGLGTMLQVDMLTLAVSKMEFH